MHETTCITTRKNTNTDKVHIRKSIFQVLQKNISKLIVCIIKHICGSKFTITKEGKTRRNATSAEVRFTFPISLDTDMIRNLGCFTISQYNTLYFLKFVFFLEDRKNLMKRHQCLIQGSSRKRKATRISVCGIVRTGIVRGQTPNIFHLMLKNRSRYFACEQIHHRE